jgi:hypothetical protein
MNYDRASINQDHSRVVTNPSTSELLRAERGRTSFRGQPTGAYLCNVRRDRRASYSCFGTQTRILCMPRFPQVKYGIATS